MKHRIIIIICVACLLFIGSGNPLEPTFAATSHPHLFFTQQEITPLEDQSNFGYESIGAYNISGANYMFFSSGTPESNGTALSITLYVSSYGQDVKVKGALYNASTLALVGTTEEKTITTTGPLTLNFVNPPSVVAGTKYLIVWWSGGWFRGRYDLGAPANTGGYKIITYGDWPATLVSPNYQGAYYSIYCTYAQTTSIHSNFGYESTGAYNISGANYMFFSSGTPESNGTALSITLYVSSYGQDVKVKGALYNASTLALVGTTEEKTITTTGPLTLNFVNPLSVVAGTRYLIVWWSGGWFQGRYNLEAPVDNTGGYKIITYGDWPATLVSPNYQGAYYSIYCTYMTTTYNQTRPSHEVYFQCDFTKTHPALNLDLYENFYYPEPCPYICEKGVWNWMDIRSLSSPTIPYGGNIRLVPDPSSPNQSCAEFILNAPGTRPLGGDQHCKVYEVQERQADNYFGSYVSSKEAWYNFKVWIPSSFKVSSWRLIWQSYGDPVPSDGTGGPQLTITNVNTYGWFFTINSRATADGTLHRYPLISTADFPKDRWVQVSIYWKQGTAWRSQDGTIKIWIDGIERLNRNDLETATESGSVYHTWGIGNYGGPQEEYGQFIRFKEVNVSNQRDI